MKGRWTAIIKSGNHRKFYKSLDWAQKRKNILIRDNNECQNCKSNGGYHKAQCVHHVKPLHTRPDLALVDNNLVSLCNSCHNGEHPEKLIKTNIKKTKKIFIEERW